MVCTVKTEAKTSRQRKKLQNERQTILIMKYCPSCQIGLNSQEMTLRICKNCEHSWDEEDENDTY